MHNPYIHGFRKIILPAVFLLFSVYVYAQENAVSGYVLTNQGDTLYGNILIASNVNNFSKCVFKESASEQVREFLPGEIDGYRLDDGSYFISWNFGNADESSWQFIEYLLDGESVDLYYYRDKSLQDRYLLQKDTVFIELENDYDTLLVGATIKIWKSRQYTGILKSAFSDQPSLWEEVDHVGFKHNELVNITRDYNDLVCPGGECQVFLKEKGRMKPQFFAEAGVSGIFYTGRNVRYPTEIIDYAPSVKPEFYVGMELLYPYSTGRLAPQIMIGFSKQTLSMVLEEELRTYKIVEEEHCFIISGGIKYNILHQKKVHPYFRALIHFNKYISPVAYYQVIEAVGSPVDGDIIYEDYIPEMNIGPSINAGIEFPLHGEKKLYIDISYTKSMVLIGVHNRGDLDLFSMKAGLVF